MSAAKCLRFKEPEVDDFVVYKYTESESTIEDLLKDENNPNEIKEEEEDEPDVNIISDNGIRNSIELLSHDNNGIKHKEIKPMENNNNNNNLNNNNVNKSMESFGSFLIYKEGDRHIVEGIPQIEVKLNLSRDNIINNTGSNENINHELYNKGSKSNSSQNILANIIKNTDAYNSNEKLNIQLSKTSSKCSINSSHSKLNQNSNSSLNLKYTKQGSNSTFPNVIPGPERNIKTKSIADRSMERSRECQKKMQERKLAREKLRSQMNEKKNMKTQEEIAINISNIETNEENNNDDNSTGKIKLVSREKPLNKNISLSNVPTNTDDNSDTIVNSNPYTPRKRSNDSEIIPKKDEDVNKILNEVGETHFLVDDTDITLENIINILGQTEVTTINKTIGDHSLESATHVKNFEHGALFRLPSEDNCILKIIPFDPKRNDLDLERSADNNQVSLKTVLQEVVAMNILSNLHINGEVSSGIFLDDDDDDNNQISLDIEDDIIRYERKALAFAKIEGMWVCKGSTNQAFNYEFQNYQLNEFSQDQYFLVTILKIEVKLLIHQIIKIDH